MDSTVVIWILVLAGFGLPAIWDHRFDLILGALFLLLWHTWFLAAWGYDLSLPLSALIVAFALADRKNALFYLTAGAAILVAANLA